MRKPAGRTLFFGGVIAFVVIAGGGFLVWHLSSANGQADSGRSKLTLAQIPFNGERAYRHLEEVCNFGPRPSGTEAMRRQQEYLERHFTSLGGKVVFQRFTVPHPARSGDVELANLIVQWHPDRRERILLAAHYDTRPFPDRDAVRPQGVFIGANDGASGVALLCEMGRSMAKLPGPYGVDFVLFDAEELVYNSRDEYFLGSNYFARQYRDKPPPYRYRAAVVVDMIADSHLDLFYEKNSITWPDSKPVAFDIWRIAKDLGVNDFVPRDRHWIRDDHLALRDTAGIPAIDIIDYDYPTPASDNLYWHTEQDTPDKCSALSLAKVGWVLQEWLRRLK